MSTEAAQVLAIVGLLALVLVGICYVSRSA